MNEKLVEPLNNKGFSLVEVLVASGILSLLAFAAFSIKFNAVETIKKFDNDFYLAKVNEKLNLKLEDDKECKQFLTSILPTGMSWKSLSGQSLEVNFPKNNYLNSLIHKQNIDNVGLSEFIARRHISKIKINPNSELSYYFNAMPIGEVKSFTLPVEYLLNDMTDRKNNLMTKGKISTMPIPIVFVLKKNQTDYSLERCYTRSSNLITEVKELCHSMGGDYRPEGCRFKKLSGSRATYGANIDSPITESEHQSGIYLSLQESLCELEKRVVEVEKNPLPPIVKDGVVIIEGVMARTTSKMSYCPN